MTCLMQAVAGFLLVGPNYLGSLHKHVCIQSDLNLPFQRWLVILKTELSEVAKSTSKEYEYHYIYQLN